MSTKSPAKPQTLLWALCATFYATISLSDLPAHIPPFYLANNAAFDATFMSSVYSTFAFPDLPAVVAAIQSLVATFDAAFIAAVKCSIGIR